MTFDNITNDTECNCLNETVINIDSEFARVLRRDTATENDFVSKWEKDERNAECEKICSLKGVSISNVENDVAKTEIINIYSQIFKLSPNYKRGVLIFKFNDDAGCVKATPSKTNKYHHDFYKSDEFRLPSISISETIILLPPSVNV